MPAVASVDPFGFVTPLSAGVTFIRVSAEGKKDSVEVTVQTTNTLPAGQDINIVNALWTQASQTSEGTIPMLTGGRAAVVNVMTSSPGALQVPTRFVLRLFTGGGALVWADTLEVFVPAGTSTEVAPTAQFLVPSNRLAEGLRWEVVRDPDGAMPDASAATDRFPRDASGPLAVVTPPTLKLRFVPIRLTSHGNTTPNVLESQMGEYIRLVRQFGPVGAIETSIAPAFSLDASFGTAPTGGTSAFWVSLLQQLDLARVNSLDFADAHWVGVVLPPAGYNFVTFGGFGYIPSSGTSTGPGTRTFGLVGLNWFNRESQTRELVMHELGHNLGRQHAPCGGAGGPDIAFPNVGGVIGSGGHDTWAFQLGASSAPVIPSNTGDTMGYCTPVWISTYTYGAMTSFRGSAVVADALPRERRVQVVVHGLVNDAGTVTLHRAKVVSAYAPVVESTASWTAIAYDETGRELGRQAFAPGRLDHLPDGRPISVGVVVAASDADRIARVEVRGPAGQTATLTVRAGSDQE